MYSRKGEEVQSGIKGFSNPLINMATKLTKDQQANQNSKIQERSSGMLRGTLNDIIFDDLNCRMRIRSEEDQHDKGVDFEIEVEQNGKSFHMFKIQNKGCMELFPLIKPPNEGLISYQVDIRNLRHYRYEIPVPLIFTVCDINNNKVYWHPIQLDDDLDKRIQDAEENGQGSIQIYISPDRVLDKATIKSFMLDVHHSFLEQTIRFRQLVTHPWLESENEIKLDRSKHILDQLYEYLSWSNNTLNYYPIYILARRYPFRVNPSYYPVYSQFKISTDNQKITEMLTKVRVLDHKTIDVSDQSYFVGVENYLKKLKFVFTKLSENYIWEITDRNLANGNHIRLYSETAEKTAEYYFSHMLFVDAFKLLHKPTEKIEAKISKAFLLYRIGNFTESAAAFIKIFKQARIDRNSTLEIICKHNLSILYQHIIHNYGESVEKIDMIENIKALTSDQIYSVYKHNEQPDIILHIQNRLFYYHSNEEISRIVKNIRHCYYAAINGGHSYNSYITELINEFADFESFILKNHIIYQTYIQFENIVEQFIEGLFASHALPESHESRLENFDDWMLYIMIFHGKSGIINQYSARYKLQVIKYKRSDQSDSFINLATNYFTGIKGLKGKWNEINDGEKSYFWDLCNQYFLNLIAILGLIETEDQLINKMIRLFVDFVKEENFLTSSHLSKCSQLIAKKQDQLDFSILEDLFILMLQQNKLQSGELMITLCQAIQKKNATLSLSNEDFEALLKIYSQNTEEIHYRSLTDWYIYPPQIIRSETQKFIITERLLKKLTTKFDGDLFHRAVILGIIPLDMLLFDKLLDLAISSNNRKKNIIGVHPDRTARSNKTLDDIINICYKFNIELNDKKFDQLRNTNSYYAWLFNMGSFNYNDFNPNWLLEYDTIHYRKAVRKHFEVKTQLIKYLKSKVDDRLQRYFFNVYNDADVIKEQSM